MPVMTIGQVIDELTYSCYKHNRERAPDITPEQWKVVFSNVDAMERKLQEEEGRKKK